MTVFTNTNSAAWLRSTLLAFFLGCFANLVPAQTASVGYTPWTNLQKKDGLAFYYDIQDCLKENLLLCIKVVNDTEQSKKLRFRVDVHHSDGTMESFNFIKGIAPYSVEKADCSDEGRKSGLLRMLKNGDEQSIVTIHFQNEGVLALD